MTKTQIEFVTVPLTELKDFVEDVCNRAVARYKDSISHNHQQVYTRKEAAVFLRFFTGEGQPNPNAIDRLRRSGKLKAVEDAGTVRYTFEALNEYLQKNASYEKGAATLR